MPPTLTVGVTGATGLIGRALTRTLTNYGHDVVAFSRSGSAAHQPRVIPKTWRPDEPARIAAALEGLDAVVHLAGEPVGRRWSATRKRAIRASRIEGTRALVQAIARCRKPPKRLIAASAIGFYGSRGDEEIDEDSAPGEGFLPEVCAAWEDEIRASSVPGTAIRIGIALSPDGGALASMLPPFRLGLGGPLGSGRQWMPWIHLDDIIGAIRHFIGMDAAALEPTYNLTAPNPATNADFTRALGRALGRPAFLPAPGFAMKLMFGEMAEALLLNGARVIPRNLLRHGFRFAHPDLEPALTQLLR